MNTTTTAAAKQNNVGASIIALNGMIARSWGKPANRKQIACRIALENNGVIRPLDARIKTHKALTPNAYGKFERLANKGDKGAKLVLDLAAKLEERSKANAARKANA